VNNYVRQPNLNGKTSGLWTNNNAESISNVLKINTNGKPQSFTALIEKPFSVVKLQYLDARRALYGAGNFCLHSQYTIVCCTRGSMAAKKQKNKKTMLSISFLKTLRERNVVIGYSQPMESILHGIKPEPS
jgi:hypothetical protein